MSGLPAEDLPGRQGSHRVVEAAEVGVLAFSAAYARWAAPENRQPFTETAHAALRDLQTRAAALGAGALALPGSGFTMDP